MDKAEQVLNIFIKAAGVHGSAKTIKNRTPGTGNFHDKGSSAWRMNRQALLNRNKANDYKIIEAQGKKYYNSLLKHYEVS